MAISPDELRNKTFAIVKKGYDRPDVHRYLGAIADELQAFNRSVAADDEIVVADVVDVEPDVVDAGPVATQSVVETTPMEPEAPQPVSTINTNAADDFDRVGNEISLMLRQAQESSIKIRQDAEVEARTLVDQVRLDIESDRLAHEQAAGELIARTEERAGVVRAEAEDYASQTRRSADEYAQERRETVERDASEALAATEADRKLAADKLAAATEEAEATVSEAKRRAEEIIASAESDAQARSDQLLQEARNTLTTLVDAEKSSRDNLEVARSNIQTALEQLRLTEIDSTAISGTSL